MLHLYTAWQLRVKVRLQTRLPEMSLVQYLQLTPCALAIPYMNSSGQSNIKDWQMAALVTAELSKGHR